MTTYTKAMVDCRGDLAEAVRHALAAGAQVAEVVANDRLDWNGMLSALTTARAPKATAAGAAPDGPVDDPHGWGRAFAKAAAEVRR